MDEAVCETSRGSIVNTYRCRVGVQMKLVALH